MGNIIELNVDQDNINQEQVDQGIIRDTKKDFYALSAQRCGSGKY